MTHPRTPVLIGAGQYTYRGDPLASPPPLASMHVAATAAARDAGLSVQALANADLVGVVGFTIDSGGGGGRFPHLGNPPRALAEALGAHPAHTVYSYMGGNTPQALVNWASERIACGEADFVLLAGAEFLGGLRKKLAAGADLAAYGAGGAGGEPERFGDPRAGCTPQEAAHGLSAPVNTYPLFENALRAHRGEGLAEHAARMGALFAPFTTVAAKNPNAWFPKAWTPADLAVPGPDNRMIGYPYPKRLNAIMDVDQAACVLMTSSERADALGVAADKRVYLHGCADAAELWNPLDRVNYHSSPAIGLCAREAFAMAGKTPADLSFIDLYSCFPVAVELACAEIGLAENDPRGLTVTGGLPYFGGPGNNYVMHSIAEMMARLRAKPGAYGLVTANGWYLTKHAFGIYSTESTEGAWKRRDPKTYQGEIDALDHPEIVFAPEGEATIETYTVTHAREGYRSGIVIGRDGRGRRFVANTPADEDTLKELESREGVGRLGSVTSEEGRNLFIPE